MYANKYILTLRKHSIQGLKIQMQIKVSNQHVFMSLRPSDAYTTHKLTIIGSDNGLSPGWRQAIIWTSAAVLLIEPLGTNSSEILIGIQAFSFKKMYLKTSGKWQPFCLRLNVLSWEWALNKIAAIFPRGQADSRSLVLVMAWRHIRQADLPMVVLSQWEMTLQCNSISRWLSPYPERSLILSIKWCLTVWEVPLWRVLLSVILSPSYLHSGNSHC